MCEGKNLLRNRVCRLTLDGLGFCFYVSGKNTEEVQRNTSQYEEFFYKLVKNEMGFPGGSVVRNLPTNAGNAGSVPGLGRSPGGHGTPLQFSCL